MPHVEKLNRNCLSYWFPKLVAAGVPVPRTEIVRTTVNLALIIDGMNPPGYSQFLLDLQAAIRRIEPDCSARKPVFLRTGQGSNKHEWNRSCFMISDAPSILLHHVHNLVEWSNTVDMIGLPHDVWCVREYLPVEPANYLERYRGMPLVREVRCFIEGGLVKCHHPYWPVEAIRRGIDARGMDPELVNREAKHMHKFASATGEQLDEALELAGRVAQAFDDDGAWSVDVLHTKRGWYVTDMAEAHRSYHEAGCTAK